MTMNQSYCREDTQKSSCNVSKVPYLSQVKKDVNTKLDDFHMWQTPVAT